MSSRLLPLAPQPPARARAQARIRLPLPWTELGVFALLGLLLMG